MNLLPAREAPFADEGRLFISATRARLTLGTVIGSLLLLGCQAPDSMELPMVLGPLGNGPLGNDLLGSDQDSKDEVPDHLRLSDTVIPPQVELVPDRPRPLIEWGDPFLGTGEIEPGIPLPTGQVIQPSFLVYGVGRTALQTFSPGDSRATRSAEAVARIDLYANLQFTGTERFFVSIRPLDQDGTFTRYTFLPENEDDGFDFDLSEEIQTIYFEGDVGEIFPNLDPKDQGEWDLGFSVGRQRVQFQDGLLLNDRLDSIGVTRNSILPEGTANWRMTALLAVDDIRRSDRVNTSDALLFALSNELDLSAGTVSLDGVYVKDQKDKEDALFLGAGLVRRIGQTNTALRIVSSFPEVDDGEKSSKGTLLFSEISRNRTNSPDLIYSTWFWGIRRYTGAARDSHGGGALDRAGILYHAQRLSRFTTALSNDISEAFGGAIGIQTFLGDPELRRQLVVEFGWRADTTNQQGSDREAIALGCRFEQALGQHLIFRLDGFVSGRDGLDPGWGLRTEFLVKF